MRRLPLLLLFCGLLTGRAAVQFNRDIRPILSDQCFACHGFDAKGRKADLRLDVEAGAKTPDKEGVVAVKPGDPAGSELWRRITTAVEDDVMPPPDSHKSLTAAQKQLLRAWIEEGAPYQKHWALEPPVKTAAPAAEAPAWKEAAPARGPVDAFLRARLAAENLSPAPEADKPTLLRRLSFALTGLPPTKAEAAAFAADTSPDAVENVVDRLLASPAFGEQMARGWLDVARYGDTHGLHLDNERSMWLYRDWVVNAFNRNLPFDRFTIEQLAGDLLPNPTDDQLIATGFSRCNVTTGEGGSIDDESRFRYAVERTATTLETWMGLTGGCAVCHDHKFDPITQKEFYQLYSFFNSAADPANDGNALLTAPVVTAATLAQNQRLVELDALLPAAEKKLGEKLATLSYVDPALSRPPPKLQPGRRVLLDDDFPAGSSVQGTPGAPATTFVTAEPGPVFAGKRALRRGGAALAQDVVLLGVSNLVVGAQAKFSVQVYLDPADPPEEVMLQFHRNGWEHRAVWGDATLIPWGTLETPSRRNLGALPKPGGWTRLEFTAETVGLAAGDFVTSYALTTHGGTATFDEFAMDFVEEVDQPGPLVESTLELMDDAFPAGAAPATNPGNPPTTFVTAQTGQVLRGARALKRSGPGLAQDFYAGGAAPIEVPANARFGMSVFLDPADPPKSVMIQFHTGEWKHRAVWGDPGLISYGDLNTTSRLPAGPLPTPGNWAKLEVDAERIGLKAGDKIQGFAFTVFDGTTTFDAAGLAYLTDPTRDPARSLAAWLKPKEGKDTNGLPPEINTLIKSVPAAKRTPAQQRQLLDYWLATASETHRGELSPLRSALDGLRREREDIAKARPASFVMRDLPKPRDSFVMKRGAYDQPGEKVVRDVPAALPPLADKTNPNRLDLARWLVDPRHPLTTRVTVNRFWQQFFGVGLVKSSGDFGSQGTPPSHPELLDALALEFRDTGWDVKRLVRTLVLSSAYRQSSAAPAGAWARDPENRLLARGPRFRLDAEQVRDNALFVSGLLNPEMGGKGVRPYQPPNIWEPVGFVGSNTANYTQDKGPALYRRSLYTFLKRTAPPPFMVNFDAPSREQSCSRRERSNTPMQALQLMNDVQYLEAARALAGRVLTEGGPDAAARIRHAYLTVLGRAPDTREAAVVGAALQRHLDAFDKSPADAAKFIRQGESMPKPGLADSELAAWTLVANLLLNLDETLTPN